MTMNDLFLKQFKNKLKYKIVKNDIKQNYRLQKQN